MGSTTTPDRAPLGRGFWALFTAGTVSNTGDGVLVAALPLLAASTTDEPWAVALISACFSLPWLLITLSAGALVDRSDRRVVMVVTDLLRAVLVGVVALLAATGEIQAWMLWLLALGLGTGEVFFDTAAQTVMPSVVPAESLERANGLGQVAQTLGNTFIGSPLGALLFSAAVWLPFGVDAASFALAAGLAMTLRGSFRPTPDPLAPSAALPDRVRVREGIAFVRRSRLLASLVGVLALTNIALAITESTFVLFVTQRLGIDGRWFGVIVGVIGLGAITAGITAGAVIARLGRRRTVILSSAVPTVSMAVLSVTRSPVLATVLVALNAASVTWWSVLAMSLRQHLVPDHMLGRVNAVFRWGTWGAMPLGAAAGGVLASVAGLHVPWIAGALASGAACLLAVTRITEPVLRAAFSEHASRQAAAEPGAPMDPTPVAIELDPLSEPFPPHNGRWTPRD